MEVTWVVLHLCLQILQKKKKKKKTYPRLLPAMQMPRPHLSNSDRERLSSKGRMESSHRSFSNYPLVWGRYPEAGQVSRSVVSNSLRPHGLQHARLPCPSPTPRPCSNSSQLGQWCHPTISSSAVPFSSCPQSFPASGSFPMSWFFASCGQTIGVSASASVLPMNIQGWFPLGWTGWIALQFKGLSRVFSNTTVQKHQFFSAQPSL